MSEKLLPLLIQGGMGVGVSNWELAQAVAAAGQTLKKEVLGVVSGTGVEVLLARRLQDGDPGGHMKQALEAFPNPGVAEAIYNEYTDCQKPPTSRYKLTPKPANIFSPKPEVRSRAIWLTVVANFVEVWLAKHGHQGPIGINHLEKIQMLHPYRLYGAMLAGVDFVLEGAGIPTQVPGVLDGLSQGRPVSYKVDVIGAKEKLEVCFDPQEITCVRELQRPQFLAIISSSLLAKVLTSRRVSGSVDGFIIEGATAGGHNAPPRKKGEFNQRGEPIYGEEDLVNLEEIANLGRPFWLAGSYAHPQRVQEARYLGAAGVQLGTIFALSDESGITAELRQQLIAKALKGELEVHTSATASPTGFPFKVVQMEGTLSETAVYAQRRRSCDIGHLVDAYQTRKGGVGFRCAAEPVQAYLQKVGKSLEDLAPEERSRLERSVCLCNALLATAGMGQKDRQGEEPGIITLGDNTAFVADLLSDGRRSYSAFDAVEYLLANV